MTAPAVRTCPQCGQTGDREVHSQHPFITKAKEGDISVCLHCSAINVYVLELRVPTTEELDRYLALPLVQATMSRVRQLREERGTQQ